MRPLPPIPDYVKLEHQVATILTRQELHGWQFDEEAARELECTLRQELSDLTKVLQNRFPLIPGAEFTPKRNNKRQGYVEGATFTRLKDFNPSSRDHIAWILQNYDAWKPTSQTSSGKVMVCLLYTSDAADE